MAAGVEKLEKEIGRRRRGEERREGKNRRPGNERKKKRDGFEKRGSLINNPKSELPSNLVQRGSMANGMRVNTESKLHACFSVHFSLTN